MALPLRVMEMLMRMVKTKIEDEAADAAADDDVDDAIGNDRRGWRDIDAAADAIDICEHLDDAMLLVMTVEKDQ